MRSVLAIGSLITALLVTGSAAGQDWDGWRGRLEAERARLEALLAKSKKVIEQVEAIEVERREALTALPDGFEAASLLESLGGLVRSCGAELLAFEQGEPLGLAPVVGLPHLLRLRVHRLGDAACVAAGLVRLERILTLESLSVRTGAERAQARLELTAWAYRSDPGRQPSPKTTPPAALPAGAPADLVRLQAQVAGLRGKADRVRALLARSERLRSGLGAVAVLQRQAATQQAMGPFFRALVSADPHPGQLRWTAGKIELSGQVEDRALLELVTAAPLPDGYKLLAQALQVRNRPAPVALDDLPDLSIHRAGQGRPALVIHAVEADALAVRSALDLKNRPLIHVGPIPERLTGRIAARDGRRALAALVRANKRLGRPAQVERAHQHGRGRKVSLQFYHAETRNVLRLLTEVGGINLVAPGELPEVTILASNLPWDGVLKAIASKAGRRVERIGTTYFLLPKNQRLPRVRAPRGRRNDLRLERAWAAEAIGLLRQATPGLDRSCLCGQGEPVSLVLRNASPREALTAILVAAGVQLDRDVCQVPVCSPPAGGAATTAPGRLVGVLSGRRSFALVRRPDGPPILVEDGGRLADATVGVRRDRLRLSSPGRDTTLLRFDDRAWEAPPVQDQRALLGRLRLAATLTGKGMATAVFEDTRDGSVRIVREGWPLDPDRRTQVRIGPGRVEVEWLGAALPGEQRQPARVFRLRPRAAAKR